MINYDELELYIISQTVNKIATAIVNLSIELSYEYIEKYGMEESKCIILKKLEQELTKNSHYFSKKPTSQEGKKEGN